MSKFVTVYSYDENGLYVGETKAQKDKNNEIMMPAYATEEKPLEIKDGFDVVMTAQGWVYQAISKVESEENSEAYIQTWEEKRKAEYPTAEEFMNAYFDGGLDDLQVKRQEVKAKYPKAYSG